MSNIVAKCLENSVADNIGGIILLALTSLCCTMPLILYHSLLVSHDITFHIFQANEFYHSLSCGTFFPKWVLESNNGYGSPNFIFYSPLSYYIVGLFHYFIPSIIYSIIVSIWLAFFLSGISMFYALKNIADRNVGLFVSVLYQLFPFHVIDLYLRGTFAELFAYIWFPLIFLFLRQMRESNKCLIISVGFSFTYAGLILTHLVSGFLVTIILFIYILFLLFSGEFHKKLISILVSLSMGLGLSACFLLPVVFERKYVKIGYILEYAFSDFRNNFLFLSDNLNGVAGRFYFPVHIAVILELLLFFIIVCNKYHRIWKIKVRSEASFFIILFLFAFFMTTPLSSWLWELSPSLKSIQFPWRWIPFMELSLLFLIVEFLMNEKRHELIPGGMKGRTVLYLLVTLFLLSLITAFNGKQKIPEKDLNRILQPEKSGYFSNLPKDYTPIRVKNLENLLTKSVPDRVSVISGVSLAKVFTWQPEKRVIGLEVFSPSVLRIATFYYPGWIAELQDRRTQIKIENDTGAMLVAVPKGRHTLVMKFVDTPLRRLAKIISMATCFIVIMFAAYNQLWERKR
jgi:hypothetical protein